MSPSDQILAQTLVFPLFIRGRHASFYAFDYFTMLFQVLEELARAMNGEISKTSSGRSEISKDQVRLDRTLKFNICSPMIWIEYLSKMTL